MLNTWLSLWKLSSEHMDYQEPSVAMMDSIRIERVWSLLGISGDWAQEGCTVLAAKQWRSGTLQWDPFENCADFPTWSERLAEGLPGLSVSVQSYSTYCYRNVPCRTAYGEETARQTSSSWILQRASNRAILAAAAKRKRCTCETSTKRICEQDTSS